MADQGEGAGAGYHLNRTSLSSSRLNLQHYNFIHEFGWYLHPSIPRSAATGTGSRIADVGTGTGIWAIELALQHPASTAVGLDISLAQTPPKQWLPSNVSMHELDMLADDIPTQFRESFDIVHLRHFFVVTADFRKLALNATKLLKPGGYLQWTEFDISRARVFKTHDHLTTTALERLMAWRSDAKPEHMRQRQSWVPYLRDTLEEDLKLETVADERRMPSPHYRPMTLEIGFMSNIEMSYRALDPEAGARLRKLVGEVEEEVIGQGKGVCATCDLVTVVCIKPSSQGH